MIGGVPKYVVTFTSMVIDADSPDEAIDRAGEFKGGGNWEAEEVSALRAHWLEDRAAVERAIGGALTSAIDAHGPITRANRSSAAKRVYSTLKALKR